MSEFPRVKVVNKGESWLGTQCYINDKKIKKVKAVNFRVAVDEIPTFDFEMEGFPDIDMFGDIRFSFTPGTVGEAVKVLRNELMKHGDIYNGFLASIKSALSEKLSPIPNRNQWIAERILKRIIGEE